MPRLDLGRALLAVALSLALWIVIQNEQNPERTGTPDFTVPVEVVETPPGMVATGLPQPIQLRVRAPADVFARLRVTSFRATVDASRATPGENRLPVRVERLDPEVRWVEPVPAVVEVRFDELRERTVPVRVAVTGTVPFGYTYAAPRATPESVTVSGPAGVVGQVDNALVEVSLERVTVSVSAPYSVKPVDSQGREVRGLRVTPATVVVDIPVSQQIAYKEVGVRPVVTGRPAPGYYLEPLQVQPASATVVGEPSALASVNFVDTEPVDVGGASTTLVRQVPLVVPPGLSLLQRGPVTVTVPITPLSTTQTFRLQPQLVGLAPNLLLASELPLVDLTVSGPAPAIQGLRPGDLRVVLDGAGLGPGRHELTPQPQVPAGLTVDAVAPETVVVVLRPPPTATAPPPTSTPAPTATETPQPAPTSTPAPPAATPTPGAGPPGTPAPTATPGRPGG